MTDYLVWSNEHAAWWAPGGRGYTTLTHMAGRYSKEQADEICRQANFRPGDINEVAVIAPSLNHAREQFLYQARHPQ